MRRAEAGTRPERKSGATYMSNPELAALRHSLKPAFLWDPARRRIVWANAAALLWFGARSLSELVERPFDVREAGVRTLARLAQAFDEDTQADEMRVQLAFPSTGQEAPLPAVVRPLRPSSGRTALLVMGEQATGKRAPVLAEILDEMPQPVLALTPAGEPVYVNAAAQELLGEDIATSMQRLFPSSLALRNLLLRALEAGTAVDIRDDIATRIGPRTLRLTARTSRQGDLVVITIDDLTDRLQAERSDMPVIGSAMLDEELLATLTAETEKPATPGLAPEELATLRRMMEAMEADAGRPETVAAGEGAAETSAPAEAVAPAEAARPEEASSTREPIEEDDSAVDIPAGVATPPEVEKESASGKASGRSSDDLLEAKTGVPRTRARISIRRRPAAGMEHEVHGREADKGEETPSSGGISAVSAPEAREEGAANGETEPMEVGTASRDDGASPVEAVEKRLAEIASVANASQADKEAAKEPETTGKRAKPASAGETGGLEDAIGTDDHEASEADAVMATAQQAEQQAEEEEEQERQRPEPPALVREVLDHRPEPIILHRSEAFYFANRAAMERFGFPLEDEAWDALAQRLASSREGAEITLRDVQGREHRFRLKRDVFPWRSGVVVQSTLEPLEARASTTSDDADAKGDAAAREASAQVAREQAEKAPAEPVMRTAEKRTPAPVIRIQTERSHSGATTSARKGGGALPKPLHAGKAPWDSLRENAVDGLLLLDEAGNIVELDAGARQLLQVAEPEAKGRPLRAFLQEESAMALEAWLASLQEDAETGTHCREMWLKTMQGHCVPVRLLLSRVRGMEANDAAFCAALCDISEWKKREEELIRAREKAEAESARKSAFLASISHELRTPLNAILGFAEVLQQELYGPLGNEKYRDYARDIHESGKHLLALVNDLLDMARVESGRLHVEFTEVDLAEVVEAAVKLLRDRIAASGIDVVRITPDNLPKVVADRRSMKQILLNLLSNAIAYGRKGGKVIVALKQHKNGGLELSVKDNGPGMTQEELEAALQPYCRVPRTGGEKTRGTGLGLPLAKALTQANKAVFEIDSVPEKGTEVRIIFPPHRVLT